MQKSIVERQYDQVVKRAKDKEHGYFYLGNIGDIDDSFGKSLVGRLFCILFAPFLRFFSTCSRKSNIDLQVDQN